MCWCLNKFSFIIQIFIIVLTIVTKQLAVMDCKQSISSGAAGGDMAHLRLCVRLTYYSCDSGGGFKSVAASPSCSFRVDFRVCRCVRLLKALLVL